MGYISFRSRIMLSLVQTSKIITYKDKAHGRRIKLWDSNEGTTNRIIVSNLLKSFRKTTEALQMGYISFRSRIMLSLVQTSKIITYKDKAHRRRIELWDSNEGTTNRIIVSNLLESFRKTTEALQMGYISFRSRIMLSLVQTSKIITYKDKAHGRRIKHWDSNEGTTNRIIVSNLLESFRKTTEALQMGYISFRSRIMLSLVQTSKIITYKDKAHGRRIKLWDSNEGTTNRIIVSNLLKSFRKTTEALQMGYISFRSRIMLSLVQTSKIITQKHKAHGRRIKLWDSNEGTTNRIIVSNLLKSFRKTTEALQMGYISFRSRIMLSLVQTSKIITYKDKAHGRRIKLWDSNEGTTNRIIVSNLLKSFRKTTEALQMGYISFRSRIMLSLVQTSKIITYKDKAHGRRIELWDSNEGTTNRIIVSNLLESFRKTTEALQMGYISFRSRIMLSLVQTSKIITYKDKAHGRRIKHWDSNEGTTNRIIVSNLLESFRKTTEALQMGYISFRSRIMLSLVQTSKIITYKDKAHGRRIKLWDSNEGTTNRIIVSNLLKSFRKTTEALQMGYITFRSRIMLSLVQTSKIITYKDKAHGRRIKLWDSNEGTTNRIIVSNLLKSFRKTTEALQMGYISFRSRIMLSLVQTSKIITQKHKAHGRTIKFWHFNEGITNRIIVSNLLKSFRKSKDLQEISGFKVESWNHWSRHQRSSQIRIDGYPKQI